MISAAVTPQIQSACLAGRNNSMSGIRRPMSERLEPKIMPITECGCWIWMAEIDPNGYGRIYFWDNDRKRAKAKLAHRIVYEHYKGPIPEGLELDHLCRIPSCVNPDHLEPVTHAENMARGIHAFKTHCKNGHELFGANLTTRPDRPRARVCRACATKYRREKIEQRMECA